MERKLDLEAELNRLLRLIVEESAVRRVILFGSAVSGESMHEWSDIDLCIIEQTDRRFYDRLAWWLKKLDPKIGLDLVVYTPGEVEQMREHQGFFIREIETKGKELYAA